MEDIEYRGREGSEREEGERGRLGGRGCRWGCCVSRGIFPRMHWESGFPVSAEHREGITASRRHGLSQQQNAMVKTCAYVGVQACVSGSRHFASVRVQHMCVCVYCMCVIVLHVRVSMCVCVCPNVTVSGFQACGSRQETSALQLSQPRSQLESGRAQRHGRPQPHSQMSPLSSVHVQLQTHCYLRRAPTSQVGFFSRIESFFDELRRLM